MDWNAIWDWIVAHKTAVSFGGVVTAGGLAVKCWKWVPQRYDGKVLSLMSEACRKARLDHPTMNIALLPFKIEEIAKDLNRTQSRVYKSLRRLEAQDEVHEVKNGEWCLGNERQKDALTTIWDSAKGRGGGRGGRFNNKRFGG